MNEYEKLANEIMYDDNGRQIDLSTEEKANRIQNICRMITKLEQALNTSDSSKIKCGSIFRDTIFIPKYIKMEPMRLSKIFQWMKNNHIPMGYNFPNMGHFEQAKKETSNYTPDTFEKAYVNEEYSREGLSQAFSDVKKDLPPKPKSKIRKHSQVELMKQKAKEGSVYDIAAGRWVERAFMNNEPGRFIDPEKEITKYETR